MNFAKVYFTIISAVTGLLGFALVLWPGFINSLFFDIGGKEVKFFIMIVGSTLIGYAVLNALAVRHNSKEIYQIAALGNLTSLTIASLIILFSYSVFAYNAWLMLLQHTVFTIGFAITLKALRND